MTTGLIVLVILIGFALILADILFIPGGIVGTLGGLFIVAAVVASYKMLGRNTAFVLGSGSVILAGILAWVSVRFKLWRVFVAEGDESRALGFDSFKVTSQGLAGKQGEVFSDLRPAGAVVIEGKKYDAVTEGGYINKGQKIEVVAFSQGQVKVRALS
jgi:membrane-bound serine protease (ClpP class)